MVRTVLVLSTWSLFLTGYACAQDTTRLTNARLRSAKSAEDSAAVIRRYARSKADSFVVEPGAGDQQRLALGTCPRDCRYGPLATIQPRMRVTDSGATTLDSGEVIARIISDGRYPKFNIQGGDTVYWWVGRRDSRLVSVFVTSRSGVRPLISNLQIDRHPRGYWKQPLARWIWNEKDEEAWGTCDGGICCRSNGLEF